MTPQPRPASRFRRCLAAGVVAAALSLPQLAIAAPATPAPPPAAHAVFPSAVAPKYHSESAAKARLHTCLDQYNANKAAKANAGLKWIQKGGGYYSQCNKRLKG